MSELGASRQSQPLVSSKLSWWSLGVGALLLGGVAWFSLGERDLSTRCPEGLVASGPRCCGTNQHFDGSGCRGMATRCSSAQRLLEGRCVGPTDRVAVPGSHLNIAVNDWDLEGKVETLGRFQVNDFWIDPTEVTFDAWRVCVGAGACLPLDSALDPELPVTDVRVEEAVGYCSFRGGRLPTSAEWLLAAGGAEGQRYPWGSFGLVCRRAAYGLVTGPCARAGAEQVRSGPDAPGSRPDGATSLGLLDLAGNVAEWTLDPPGNGVGHARVSARGGSFRSTLASELKVLSASEPRGTADDVGFRCAYDRAE